MNRFKLDGRGYIILIIGILLFIQAITSAGGFLNLVYTIPGLLFAISVHEASHAFAAYKLGDNTSKSRITLNPFKHLDPLGVISLLILHIGWGKPVEINPYNLKNKKISVEKAECIIAAAGPASNIISAILLIVLLKYVTITSSIISTILVIAVYLNLGLGIFNLIPIPPLDGYKIIAPLLNNDIKTYVRTYESYIQLIFFAIIIIAPNSLSFITVIQQSILSGILSILP